MTAGGCVFGGVGVLSRGVSETRVDPRIVGVADCEEPGDLRETGGKFSVTNSMSPEGNFGDDLSTVVNGVSGTEDGEGEESC